MAIVTVSPCSFSKKNGQIMPLDQNLSQAVTRFGCVGFSMYACGFSVPQMLQFCLFTYDDFFFCQNRHSQDNEHAELTELLFVQNPYAIFAHILQHNHDFQSNVLIFPSVFKHIHDHIGSAEG